MNNITIINLCDRPFDQIKEYFEEEKSNNSLKMQIGSYTCGNYFVKCLDWISKNKNYPKKYDVVIPVLAEHDLWYLDSAACKECIENADQIVVNDVGMLKRYYSQKKIRLGRLMVKDYRDFRYSDYNDAFYLGKAETLIGYLRETGYSIDAIESDIITKHYCLQIDSSIDVFLHFPYRQISACHICEFASIGKKIESKFIPDDCCDLQCFLTQIRSKEGYVKVGKNVFDVLNEDYVSEYIKNHNIIITPRWHI